MYCGLAVGGNGALMHENPGLTNTVNDTRDEGKLHSNIVVANRLWMSNKAKEEKRGEGGGAAVGWWGFSGKG